MRSIYAVSYFLIIFVYNDITRRYLNFDYQNQFRNLASQKNTQEANYWINPFIQNPEKISCNPDPKPDRSPKPAGCLC